MVVRTVLQRSVILFFICMCISIVHGAQQNVAIELFLQGASEQDGKQYVTVGEMFQIRVVVTGGDRMTGEVAIDGLDKLEVLGSSRSTSIELNNSVYSSTTTYLYDVAVSQEGVYDLGPAHLQQKGKHVNSNKITFHGVASQNMPATVRRESTSTPSSMVEISLLTDKSSVVLGEPVVLTARMMSRLPLGEVSLTPPTLPGFAIHDVEQVEHTKQETPQGVFNVIEKKFIIVPSKKGTHTIGPISIRYQVPVMRQSGRSVFNDPFFSSFFGSSLQTKQALSNTEHITVTAIPKGTIVDGVGIFDAYKLTVQNNRVNLNEPFEVTLTLSGIGNFDHIATPQLQGMNGMKYYPSKQTQEQNFARGLEPGSKTFRYIMQITTPGSVTIPPQNFTYFDYQAREKRVLSTLPVSIEVVGERQQSVIQNQDQEKKTAKEVAKAQETGKSRQSTQETIHFVMQSYDGYDALWHLPWYVFLIALLLPLCFYTEKLFSIGLFLLGPSWRKKKHIDSLANRLENIEQQKNMHKLYGFMLDVLSTALEVKKEKINQSLLEKRLPLYHFTPDKVQEFLLFLDQCARHAYASNSPSRMPEQSLVAKARYWFLLLTKKNSGEKK